MVEVAAAAAAKVVEILKRHGCYATEEMYKDRPRARVAATMAACTWWTDEVRADVWVWV